MNAPSHEPARVTLSLDEALQRRALARYAPDCRYVLGAELSHPRDGRPASAADPSSWLRIDAECDVAQAHHRGTLRQLDAVTVCLLGQQLLDLVLAAALRHRLLGGPAWTAEDFDRHQPADVLIADYQASFRRPVSTRRFRAWLAISSVQPRLQRNLMLLKTRGGSGQPGAEAFDVQFTVALLDWPAT